MKTRFDISNFKVFGTSGASVNISPITILTGCNSSGKSSITKSLLLLDSFLKDMKNGKNVKDLSFDFSSYPNSTLGSFKQILNEDSNSSEITFKYTLYSHYLGEDIQVKLIFSDDNEREIQEGYLKSIQIFTQEGGIIYEETRDKYPIIYVNKIKNQLITLYEAAFSLYDYYRLVDLINDNVIFESIKEEWDDVWKRMTSNQQRTKDIFTIKIDRNRFRINEISYNIESFSKSSSYYYLPIFDKLGKLSKEEIFDCFSTYIEKYKYFEQDLKEILSDFYGSKFDNFIEYIFSKEEEYLNKGISTSKSLIVKWESIPNLFGLPTDLEFLKPILSPSINYKDLKDFISSVTKEIKSYNTIRIDHIYCVFTIINILENVNSVQKWGEFNEDNIIEPIILSSSKIFMEDVLKESVIPYFTGTLSYISSNRIETKRVYDVNLPQEFNRTLKRYVKLAECNDFDKNDFINKWLKSFGIGDSLIIDYDSEAFYAKIKIVKNGVTRNLADVGYGISQILAILLHIGFIVYEPIEIKNPWNTPINSDKIKIYKELYDFFKIEERDFYNKTIVIEEPEIHLHPNYQSLLADLFIDAWQRYNIHFIIETHSEYLIRRLQVRVAEKLLSNTNVSINYVDTDSFVYDLGVCPNGKLLYNFGPGFFDEADNSAMELFDLNNESTLKSDLQ